MVEDPEVLTGTQTSRQLIQMFNFDAAGVPGTGTLPEAQDDGEGRLSTVEEASLSPGVLSLGGWSLDGDDYNNRLVISPSILQTVVSRSVTPPPRCSAITSTSSATTTPIVTSAVHRQPGPGPLRPRIVEASSARVSLAPRFSVPVFPPRPVVPQPGGIRGPASRPPAKDRKRSQSSECLSRVSANEAAKARFEDRRFELTAWIRTRRNLIATRLIAVEETIAQAGGPGSLSPLWINEELQFVLRTLEGHGEVGDGSLEARG